MPTTHIEAVLFAVAKPIPKTQLQKHLGLSEEVVTEALAHIRERFNTSDSGIHLLDHDGKVQFVTNPDQHEPVSKFLKDEASGPLTRPSLETLTIIAYRGPITKPEIEQIRGVNCSLILRNLSIRGLVDEREDKERLQPVYTLSMDLMKTLGVTSLSELPEYETFHANEKITDLINEMQESASEDL